MGMPHLVGMRSNMKIFALVAFALLVSTPALAKPLSKTETADIEKRCAINPNPADAANCIKITKACLESFGDKSKAPPPCWAEVGLLFEEGDQ
jgi:hypothetical protein